MWMEGATQSVRWKLNACKKFGLLGRSLKPRSTKESEWQTLAVLGARTIAQARPHVQQGGSRPGGRHRTQPSPSCQRKPLSKRPTLA